MEAFYLKTLLCTQFPIWDSVFRVQGPRHALFLQLWTHYASNLAVNQLNTIFSFTNYFEETCFFYNIYFISQTVNFFSFDTITRKMLFKLYVKSPSVGIGQKREMSWHTFFHRYTSMAYVLSDC